MTREQIHARRWAILGVLILALFGVSVDNTILTIALPTVAVDLSATAGQLQWMVDAYILVFAGLLLVGGALSDRFGRRLALVVGLTLFGLGSAIAPFVTDANQLIALRAFMGLGAALTMPATLSIIADVFPANERPKAIAAWSAVSGLGIVVGPLLGGWLLEHYAWASVFVVNVPFVAVGIAATLAVVPESRAPGRVPLDPVGALLSVAGLVALVYGIVEIPASGWTDPAVVAALAGAVVLGAAFVAWERRQAHPMLDVGLFRDRRFSAASLSVTLTFFSLMGAMFFLTMYLQAVLGLSALETGVRFLPIAAGVIVAAPLGAQLTAWIGTRITTATGLAVVALGLGLVATLGVESSDLHLSVVLFVAALGMGLAMTPATDAIMAALPQAKLGVGSAVNDTTREIGGALGVAVLGSLAAGSYAAAVGPLAATLPPEAAAAVRDSITGASAVADMIGGTAGEALLGAARQAFVDAMASTSILGAIVALAGAGLALAFLPDRVHRPVEAATEGPEPVAAPVAAQVAQAA